MPYFFVEHHIALDLPFKCWTSFVTLETTLNTLLARRSYLKYFMIMINKFCHKKCALDIRKYFLLARWFIWKFIATTSILFIKKCDLLHYIQFSCLFFYLSFLLIFVFYFDEHIWWFMTPKWFVCELLSVTIRKSSNCILCVMPCWKWDGHEKIYPIMTRLRHF